LDRYITKEVILFVLLEYLVAIYISPIYTLRGVVITLVDHVWDVFPYYSCNIRNFSK